MTLTGEMSYCTLSFAGISYYKRHWVDTESFQVLFYSYFFSGLFSEMIALKQGLEEYSDSSDLNSDDEVNLA